MKSIVLLLANTISLLITVLINYSAGMGAINGQSVGEVSNQYPVLITPAGYAFSIWGLIYLLLLAFTVYQWVAWLKGRNEESLFAAGHWFYLANVANALWVLAWIYEALGLSVLLMLFLLFCLLKLVVRLKLETWNAPFHIIAFVWWPICIYTGWIVLASVVSISVYLGSFNFLAKILPPEVWAMIMISVAGLVYLFLTWSRNMREAALVGVWGLVAIAVKQWGRQDEVAVMSLITAAILFISAAYHGFRNFRTKNKPAQ